jgi:hypothetical protein
MTSTAKPTATPAAKKPVPMPEPGRKKKNPRELEKLLDTGLEDSMAASDPPAVTQPEVHTEAGRDATRGKTDGKKAKKK